MSSRHRRDPYTCPRCGYETPKRDRAFNHLYNLKKPCPASRCNIPLTEAVKQFVLDNRIYHPVVLMESTNDVTKVVHTNALFESDFEDLKF